MQLLIKMPSDCDEQNKALEWAMIELQGDLESRCQDALSGKFIGDLNFTNEGIPILIIGHHILFGKLQVLGKPFAVLEQKRHDQEDKRPTEYIIKAIIRKKLLFKTRPKPIIANVAKKK